MNNILKLIIPIFLFNSQLAVGADTINQDYCSKQASLCLKILYKFKLATNANENSLSKIQSDYFRENGFRAGEANRLINRTYYLLDKDLSVKQNYADLYSTCISSLNE